MKRHFVPQPARIPWGLLAAVGLGATAAALTVAHGVPAGYDAGSHLYRLVERNYLIQHGLLFSRWSPVFGFGYGFPLYNYYPPLLCYLAEPFVLAGLGPLTALQLVLGFALIVGSLGMYLWAGDMFGAGPGVVAAAVYVFSPYLMYTLLNRGGFPELVVLACMPWGAWSLRRYATRRGLLYAFVVAASLAVGLCTHLFSSYLCLASLLIYAVGLTLGAPEGCRKPGELLRVLWPVALGLGLAAICWLPAMWESGLIRIERVLAINNPTKGQGFMSLWTVFASPFWPAPGIPLALVPPRLSSFGAGVAVIGLVAGLAALRSSRLRWELLAGCCVLLGAVFMVTPASRIVWAAVPMLQLAQFPFRFLAVASLWLALLASSGAAALLALIGTHDARRTAARIALVSLFCAASVLYVLVGTPPAYLPLDTAVDLAAATGLEKTRGTMGLLAASEYLPKTVKQIPPAMPDVDFTTDRLDLRSLPTGARVIEPEYDLLRYSLIVESAQAFTAQIKTFYFPGWWATIDGIKTPITPTDPRGLIAIPIPAGRHRVMVGFGSTQIRTASTVLSLISLMGVLGLALAATQRSRVVASGSRMLRVTRSLPNSLSKEVEL